MKFFRFFLMAFALIGLTPLNAMFTEIDSDESESPFSDESETDTLFSQFKAIQMSEAASPTTQLLPSESSASLVAVDNEFYENLLGEDEDLLAVQTSPVPMHPSRKAVFVATAGDTPSSPYSPIHKDLVRHSQYLTKLDVLINKDMSNATPSFTYESAVNGVGQRELLEQFKNIQSILSNAQTNVRFANTKDVVVPEEIATVQLIELSKITGCLNEMLEKQSVSRDEYIFIVGQAGKFIEATIRLIDSVNVSQARVNTLQSQAMPKNRLKTSKKAYTRYYSPLLDRSIEGISVLLNRIMPSLQATSYFGPGTMYEMDLVEISKCRAALFDIEYEFMPNKYFSLCQKVQDLKEWVAQDFAYDKIRHLARLVSDITAMIAQADELPETPFVAFGRPYAALVDELSGICQIAQPIFEHIELQESDTINAKMRLDIAQIIRSVVSLHVSAQFEHENLKLSDSVSKLLEEPSRSAHNLKKLLHSASESRLHVAPSRLSISPASSMWHIDSQDCHYPRGQTPVSTPEWVEYESSDAMSRIEDLFVFMMTDPVDARIGKDQGEVLVQQFKQVYGRVAELSHRQSSFASTSHAQWVSTWLLQYCQAVLTSFIEADIPEHVEGFNVDPSRLNEIIESLSSVYNEELKSSWQGESADFVQTSSSLYKILQRLLQDLQAIGIDQQYVSKTFVELNESQKAELLLQIENILHATTLAASKTRSVLYYLQDSFDLQEIQTQQTQAQMISLFLLGQIFKVVNFTHLVLADLFGNDEITLHGVMKLLSDAHSYGDFHAEWAHQALHNIRPASAAM